MSQTTFSGPVASQNGFIENSFTTAARDAIPNPTVGLLIYNTTTNTYQVYNGTSWQTAFGGGGGSLPVITNSSPTSGPISGYTRVDIYGTNIDNVSSVTFGGTPGIGFISLAPGWVEGFAPPHAAGTVNIQLTTPNGSAISPNTFTYVGPAITAISPNISGYSGGNTATITGTGFTSPATVAFGSNSATNVSVINTTAISAVIPSNFAGGTVNVSVTTPNGTATLSNAFTYLGTPSITQVYPNVVSQSGGTTILVSGSNFVSPLTVNFVDDFAITPLTPTIINSSAFTVVTPARVSAPSAYLNVTNSIGSGISSYLPFVTAPVINTVTPNTGSPTGGTSVTLSGSNFYAPISVSFGGTASSNVTITNSNVAVAIAPAGTVNTTVSVSVSSVGGSNTKSNAYTYAVTPPTYSSYQTSSSFISTPNRPIALSADGTKMTMMGPTNVAAYTMSSDGDVTTLVSNGYSTLPALSGGRNYTFSCVAFNGDGTKMFTTANASGSVYNVAIDLLTPYDSRSLTGSPTSPLSAMFGVSESSLPKAMLFNADGSKGYLITGDGYGTGMMYQYDMLGTPYNINGFNSAYERSVNLATLGGGGIFGMTSPVTAIFSPTGDYIYFLFDASYSGGIAQFKLNTPFDIGTIASTYNVFLHSPGGGYGTFLGITRGSTDAYILTTSVYNYIYKFIKTN